MIAARAPFSILPRPLASASPVVRRATRDDAAGIHLLIARNQATGHLLPRAEDEIARHADRFFVVIDDGEVAGCAELAPLSTSVAEVRSLVVDDHFRGLGYGRILVESLTHEAQAKGYASLCALTHEPGYFVRLGFALVPHSWLPEKITVDCAGCALFRICGQSAMRLRLNEVQVSAAPRKAFACR
jgi:N-acetylglutamate synthase-like GNAT family acetyltransferase